MSAAELVDAVATNVAASLAALAGLRHDDPIAVACSGGRDSTALVHAALQALPGRPIVALHVHHGLSRQADAWLAHLERQCASWRSGGARVEVDCVRLDGSPSTGDSVEAWARAGRYRALAAMAARHHAPMVLLGHHRRDQAETFLLQALRGGGLKGLASMPLWRLEKGLIWLRPWLDRSRESIDEYVAANGLCFVDDDSNADERFSRNRLRLGVWPALLAAFPQAEASLTQAARWAQEAGDALSELAEMDLGTVSVRSSSPSPSSSSSSPSPSPSSGKLQAELAAIDLVAFQRLSFARQSNVLRAWLSACERGAASMHLVERLLTELPGNAPASWATGKGTLGRYRGVLRYRADRPGGNVDGRSVLHDEQPVTRSRWAGPFGIEGPGVWPAPGWHGEFVAESAEANGIAVARLANIRLAHRSAGESFQVASNRPARSLKKQFQAASIPEWGRVGPLIYAENQLVFVPGLGIDARAFAEPQEPQVTLRWRALPHTG